MKKNVLKYVLIILFLGSLTTNVYFFLVKDNSLDKDNNSNGYDKLELPIYEVTYSETGITDIINEIDDLSYISKYKLIDKVKCKYDLCYWYDYNMSKMADVKWIYYDNNEANEGGYYIFDHELNKTIYGPYKDFKVDSDELSSKILQGVYLYSYDDKVGYFDLRGLNKMLFEVEYDYIESSPFHSFYVTKNSEGLTLYSFFSNKLNKVSDDIDDINDVDYYTFAKGVMTDYVITQKDGKYNLIYGMYGSVFETNDNYDFLSVYEPRINKDVPDLYFVYAKNGETYLSKTDIHKLSENNSLVVDSSYNHKISTKVEQWFITSTEMDEILHIYSNNQDEYYVIDLNENKLPKKQNS